MTAALASSWVRPSLIATAYFVAVVVAVTTTRFQAGVAFIWVANAVLVAELFLSSYRSWWRPLLLCATASMVATSLFGVGPAGAVPLAAINILESVTGAVLMQRFGSRAEPFGSIHGVALFIVSVAVIGPLATAPLSAVVIAAVLGGDFLQNCLRWYAGHALGALTFVPIAVFVLSGEVRRWLRSVTAAGAIEAAIILTAVAATSMVVFSQERYPLLFLPLLPLMVAAFRAGGLGAACAIIVIAAIGTVLTLRGSGPIHLMEGAALGDKIQFLQFYLAVLALTVLPVAADLRRRATLFQELRESEARYRLLADNSSDIVMNMDVNGRVCFVSRSITSIGGYAAGDVVGRSSLNFVHTEDRAAVIAAHRSAIRAPGEVRTVEYRALAPDKQLVWVEARAQAVVDDNGHVTGLVSAIRNIEAQKDREQELAREASTDALTGLLNRRGFFAGVDRLLSRGSDATRGCLAMFDLDHFKQINDRFGHAAGDRVLEEFARVARLVVRDDDLVGRLGGEEFGILLRGASWDHAVMVCDRLRAGIAARPIRSPGGEPIAVTVSAGVVALEPGLLREDLYQRADEALYRAKAAGRNQIALAA